MGIFSFFISTANHSTFFVKWEAFSFFSSEQFQRTEKELLHTDVQQLLIVTRYSLLCKAFADQ